MATEVPAGQATSFEVTYDSPSLQVAMRVFDNTTGTPVQVGSPIAMTNFFGNTYQARFTPVLPIPYLVHKAVYTDGTFVTLDNNYAAGSEGIIAVPVPTPAPQQGTFAIIQVQVFTPAILVAISNNSTSAVVSNQTILVAIDDD